MATLTPTLTLSSSDIASDVLNMTVTDSLTVTVPAVGLSKRNVTATGGDHIIVPAGTAISYLFVRHTGTTDGSTATSQLVDLENTDNEAFARLKPGEFLFLPFCHAGASVGVQLHSQGSNVQCEYAFFTAT